MTVTLALVGAAAVGSVGTIALWGGHTTSASTPAPRVSTATVVRTDLTSTTLTEGTLGYAPTDPVVNRASGTYTALPPVGSTITAGEVLYRVDDLPVVLMAGGTPAWRAFSLGMTDGPDVTELEANLIALGDAAGLLTSPGPHFSGLTADAVGRWQSSNGLAVDDQVPFGEIVFMPTPVLVGSASVALGQGASPDQVPYQVSTLTRVVTVPLSAGSPSARVGESVSIVLPTNATTPGTVTAVGPAPLNPNSGSQGSSAGSGGTGGSDQSQVSAVLTVTPLDPAATGSGSGVAVQVALVTQSATGVLAVPISALLALAGGGYGVEVIGPSRVHRLVAVTTGMFTGSQVEITGTGIGAGTRVVVAQ